MTDLSSCPFCHPEAGRIFHAGERVLGLWDAFPVSPGHALLVPKRHVATWFDATKEEQAELVAAIDIARAAIQRRLHDQPDGYNIGVNVGRAAGQTVFHLHMHVIPRKSGDVPDPRGGVRHVIPGKGNYLLTASPASTMASRLVRGGEDPLLPELIQGLAGARRVDCAVAFVLASGVERLRHHLRDVVRREGRVRLLAGDYLDVTEPHALRLLLDLAVEPEADGRLALRVFESSRVGTGYHPKGYLLFGDDQGTVGSAYVGSSNLSRSALGENIEWNFRIEDEAGLASVRDGFERLWASDATAPLTAEWIDRYEGRRRKPRTAAVLTAVVAAGSDPDVEEAVEVAPPELPPDPHPIQAQALAALRATRAEGNAAALVVLATGLGKTFLAAFDSANFGRVLFVAHRDEILEQAYSTFRRVRPSARLGYYTGQEKSPDAEVVFASVQTLGRIQHLGRFARTAFDYIVIDEFHHASARTYRKVIDWFTPKFLLGLTATPERTDGGDLLALCGENLAYRCDLARGIDEELLSPFRYFGVPDTVDYAQIPWRSQRFDEEELTRAVATEARAKNALEQWRKFGGHRTLGFCVSQKHADFMAEFFTRHDVEARAVHAGKTSSPRVASLEALEEGRLPVLFAVDLFNEGVDVKAIDTVLMLRPTESRIVYLQQLGRGLRRADGKDHLRVIDYIGNHRSFLTKVCALLGLEVGTDAEIRLAMHRLAAGELGLPRGCEVTYELEAREMLESLLRETPGAEDVRRWYEVFKELHGTRPTAAEAMHEGFNPRAVRKHYGSWLGFVEAMGDLSDTEIQMRRELSALLEELETTQMSRSYKMLVLLSMLNEGCFPGAIGIDELQRAFVQLVARSARLRADVSVSLEDAARVKKLLEQQPIPAWTGGKGTGGTSFFAYSGSVFRTTFESSPAATTALQDLVRELADWRLADYLQRTVVEEGVLGLLRVSHNKTDPILFFDRKKAKDLPEGWTRVEADGQEYEANFVKVAVNVARRPDHRGNALPAMLRGWFGDRAGRPGSAQWVVCERTDHGYRLRPRAQQDLRSHATRLQRYQRREIPELFGATYDRSVWDQGYVRQQGQIVLLATLEEKGMRDEHARTDRFLSPTSFEWSSQNQMSKDMPMSLELRDHEGNGVPVHLFVRAASKLGGETAPFLYLGEVVFRDWSGDPPLSVTLELKDAVPEPLWAELRVRLTAPPRS